MIYLVVYINELCYQVLEGKRIHLIYLVFVKRRLLVPDLVMCYSRDA